MKAHSSEIKGRATGPRGHEIMFSEYFLVFRKTKILTVHLSHFLKHGLSFHSKINIQLTLKIKKIPLSWIKIF